MKQHKPYITVLVLALFAASGAFADKGGNGKGHEKHVKHEKHEKSEKHEKKSHSSKVKKHHDDDFAFILSDRDVIKEYISSDYHTSCPPGLAKKHNGCMPPGQAKKAYVIGQPLPAGIVFSPVPRDLRVKLRPAPMGYQYVMVDRDVLLMAEASHKIVDAVTLLSAVGR